MIDDRSDLALHFLRQPDADKLIQQAAASNVLSPQNTASTAIGQ